MSGSRVIGIGLDLVEIGRIRAILDKRRESFLNRILGPAEKEDCNNIDADELWVARRFAAKEACMKALGTGWAQGVGFPQIQVLEREEGLGIMNLSLEALRRAEGLGCNRAWVSFSGCAGLAGALVFLEGPTYHRKGLSSGPPDR